MFVGRCALRFKKHFDSLDEQPMIAFEVHGFLSPKQLRLFAVNYQNGGSSCKS